MAAKNRKSGNFSDVLEECSLGPWGYKICLKSLYLLQFEINFSISAKIQDDGRKSEKSKFFRGASGVDLQDPKLARNHSNSYVF